MEFATDGVLFTHPSAQGFTWAMRARWSGDVLTVTREAETQGISVSVLDEYSLSADGNSLTQTRSVTQSGDGHGDSQREQSMIFRRDHGSAN